MDYVFLMDPLNFNGHIGFAPRDGNVSTLDPFSTSVWKTEQWSHESQFKGLWALWQVKKKKEEEMQKKVSVRFERLQLKRPSREHKNSPDIQYR